MSTNTNEVKNDKVKDMALTTLDNPYDPFTQFDEWFNFDTMKGYNSCSLLDRIIENSVVEFSFNEDKKIEAAIDEIVEQNPMIYKKVVQS